MTSPSSPPQPKLIVITGATGNQGGSVARRFLRENGPDGSHILYRVRGLTRNIHSPAAQKLTALGAEMVRADLLLDDVETQLKPLFAGAHAIFSVTNYWEPFLPPNRDTSLANAQSLGIPTVREYAGYIESTIGRKIADAAATTCETLDANGFLASTLSHAARCSGGRFDRLYHFDAKADVFPYYVRDKYPALAAKMNCIQTGFFMTSHQILPESYLAKLDDGSFEMRLCTNPQKVVPHLDPVADMGNFVYAVYQVTSSSSSSGGGGKEFLAEGTTCTWPEWIAAWGQATGVPTRYKQITREEMANTYGGEDFGGEIADMFDYSSDPGYDGGQNLLKADYLRKEGLDCPMTTLTEWMKSQDWSSVLSKPVT